MANLSKQLLALWAKKSNKDGQELWLPLIAHLIDTQNVINWLYNHWLSDNQRNLLQGDLTDIEIEKLVKFVGFFHDIGKATPVFQTKISYNRDIELDNALTEKLIRSGFDNLDEFIPLDSNRTPHAIAGESLLENAGLNESIGAIIGSHHGKPADDNFDYYYDQISQYTSNYYQSDINEKLQESWQQVQRELIGYGLKKSGYNTIEEVPTITQPQAILLTGLLIMADWIASSEYLNNDITKPMFPLIRLNQAFTDLNMQERFQNAIVTWKVSGHYMTQPILDISKQYEKRWGFQPRKVQQLMSEQISRITDPGIIIIEAPMGIGKTEIALLADEQLSFMTGTTGLFMGLPTQATSNAMFDRVNDWVERLAEEENTKLPIKLMHGKAQFNKKARELPLAENVDNDSAVVVNSWFNGKKSILADFSIGTIDHLLLMSLKQRHLFLRHLGLSGKVVIIDEVHAYDSYMDSYLKRALQWLGAYHIPVIALSATLPKEKRVALVQAYFQGKYGRKKLDSPEGWEDNQAYPLLTYLDGSQVQQLAEFPPVKSHKNQIIRLQGDDTELIKKVLADIQDGGVAGIVVNTVKRAQTLSKLLPPEVPQLVLHSAFLAPDRAEREKELQKLIGKGGQRPEKMVIIGTQVLEQSLDIDFDVLYTDIAPIDLILQRIGRLHRHDGTYRPQNLAQAKTYVLGINSFGDYGDANEAVYEKYYLMKTDYFLPKIINLPGDISKLVQKVYDPETNQQIKDIEEPYHAELVAEKKEKVKAQTFQISSPQLSDTIHGWLDNDRYGVDTSDTKAEAAVRDIKEAIEVVLVQHTEKGDFLINGKPLSLASEVEIAQQLIRLPNALTPNIDSAIKKLETLTMKHYPNWQNSVWLRGMLALPLDKDLKTTFNDWQISYSKELGLAYKKED